MSHHDESMGDFWRGWKKSSQDYKARVGIDCPGCIEVQPKRIPTRLIPGKRCKVCGTTYSLAKTITERKDHGVH